MSNSSQTGTRPVTEADYEKAKELLLDYIDEHHETIFWYLQSTCHATKEQAEDAMQNLWLHVFQQLSLKRADKMYRSYLYNKARWVLSDLKCKAMREDPFDISSIDLRGKDQLEEHEQAALDAMYQQSIDAKLPEPANREEEAALFKRFWERFPNIDVTEEDKLIAFDRYRFGMTLKEASEKYGISISTLSDRMRKLKYKLEIEGYKEEDES